LRSKKTNALQVSVVLSGIIFIIMGLFFYISPVKVISIFAQNVSENWFDLVRDHELVAPLYYILRAFSAVLFTSGFLMIMPLFDPLKYRGIIWFNGVIFPLMAFVILIKTRFFSNPSSQVIEKVDAEKIGNVGNIDYSHIILLLLGVVFFVIFLLNVVMLQLTRSDAKQGKE